MSHILLSDLSGRHLRETHYLGQVFNNTTNSYKFFWLMAIIDHLPRAKAACIPIDDLLLEMVVLSWQPVLLFRLSLGRQDKLQNIVLEIQQASTLQANCDQSHLRQFIHSRPDIMQRVQNLGRYVPLRFLSPWFARELSGKPDDRKNTLIREHSSKSQESAVPCPYFFKEQDDSHICLNLSWVEFLQENSAVIKAFVEYHTVQYLQRRNPNAPNVISKLRAPSKRNLSHARRFWKSVEREFRMQEKRHWFQDIYSRRELGEEYAIDHFCPWSFVVHDHIWNLVPVAQVVNSSKGNRLPDFEHYIPDMAKLHLRSLKILKQFPVLLEEYINCYKIDWDSLCQTDEEQFYQKVRDNFMPLFITAKNQGFETDWRYEG